MFIFVGIIPIGLRDHSRFKVVSPKLFAQVGKPGFIPVSRGTDGKITTAVYPETRDKHDFYMTYTEQRTIPTGVTKDPIRRKWGEAMTGIIPVAIRYRWNRKEERIDSAFMVTPDGKSKIKIDERGNPIKIYFKPNSVVKQQCLDEKPLILKADIESTQIGIMVQNEEGCTSFIKMSSSPVITDRLEPKEIVRNISQDDYGAVRGKWEKATDDMFDPRSGIDKDVLRRQLFLFVGHYNDKKARFEIESRYKSHGSSAMN